MSSTNNLHKLLRPFGKSLTYIKNKRRPRMEPCGIPARISTQDKHSMNVCLVKMVENDS